MIALRCVFFLSCNFCVWLEFFIYFVKVAVMWLLSVLAFVDLFVKYSVIDFCARRSVKAVFKLFCVGDPDNVRTQCCSIRTFKF